MAVTSCCEVGRPRESLNETKQLFFSPPPLVLEGDGSSSVLKQHWMVSLKFWDGCIIL